MSYIFHVSLYQALYIEMYFLSQFFFFFEKNFK